MELEEKRRRLKKYKHKWAEAKVIVEGGGMSE
jgi:hypothetical protein